MNQNESQPKKKKPVRGFVVLVVLYLIFSLIPALKNVIKGVGSGISEISENTGFYYDLELKEAEVKDLTQTQEWKSGILAEKVPELKEADLNAEPGSRLCRFDVTVLNKGTCECRYNDLVFLESEDNKVRQIFTDTNTDTDVRDTRMIPPGREAGVTAYAVVQPDATECTVKTYCTKGSDPDSITVRMIFNPD